MYGACGDSIESLFLLNLPCENKADHNISGTYRTPDGLLMLAEVRREKTSIFFL